MSTISDLVAAMKSLAESIGEQGSAAAGVLSQCEQAAAEAEGFGSADAGEAIAAATTTLEGVVQALGGVVSSIEQAQDQVAAISGGG